MKNIIFKLFVMEEGLDKLLPVVATFLQFNPEEMRQIQAARASTKYETCTSHTPEQAVAVTDAPLSTAPAQQHCLDSALPGHSPAWGTALVGHFAGGAPHWRGTVVLAGYNAAWTQR